MFAKSSILDVCQGFWIHFCNLPSSSTKVTLSIPFLNVSENLTLPRCKIALTNLYIPIISSDRKPICFMASWKKAKKELNLHIALQPFMHMLKNDRIYIKNSAVLKLQDFWSMLDHFSTLCTTLLMINITNTSFKKHMEEKIMRKISRFL